MKKSKLVRVVFEPGGTEVFVPAGTLLSKAAAASGNAVETPCGGVGTCGKCRVVVQGALSDPCEAERQRLSDAEIDQLAREGIIGTEMLMEEQLVKEKKRVAG